MKKKSLQDVSLSKQDLTAIKGGYKYVFGAAEAASFIGTAVDIRLGLGKGDVTRTNSFRGSLEIATR